jgi:hypothetical protein
MKADDVAWSIACEIGEDAKRVFIERAFLGKRVIAGRKEWRVHRPPAHDQINHQSQRRLIKEPTAHRKEKLLAPRGVAKEHRRDGVHVEE